jgi:hypothetical protein
MIKLPNKYFSQRKKRENVKGYLGIGIKATSALAEFED